MAKLGFTFLQKNRQLGQLYPDQTIIFRQGDISNEAFVIQKGKVELSQEIQGKIHHLEILKKGEIFGITALFSSDIRIVTARAKGDCRIMKLDQSQLIARLSQDPSLAMRILGKAFRRMENQAGVLPAPNLPIENNPSVMSRHHRMLVRKLASSNKHSMDHEIHTQWQRTLQKQVQWMTSEALSRGLFSNQERKRLASSRRKQLLEELDTSHDPSELRKHLKLFYQDFYLCHTLESQKAVLSVLQPNIDEAEHIAFIPYSSPAKVALMLYAPDHPALLGDLTATLALHDISIQTVHRHNLRNGMTLHVVIVRRPAGDWLQNSTQFEKIQKTLHRSLKGKERLSEQVLSQSWQQMNTHLPEEEKHHLSDVQITNEHTGTHTFLSINTFDRLGFLYVICRIMEQQMVWVRSLTVTTDGPYVHDTFYLTDLMGKQLEEAAMERLRLSILKIVS
ncbi:MAG: cyclic nucleotide-binding domain-containing protein [Magnetococcales bacterium]|nr:cyclic nucleotide-binding domain-containing protein [Magnetococcales bacterium]